MTVLKLSLTSEIGSKWFDFVINPREGGFATDIVTLLRDLPEIPHSHFSPFVIL